MTFFALLVTGLLIFFLLSRRPRLRWKVLAVFAFLCAASLVKIYALNHPEVILEDISRQTTIALLAVLCLYGVVRLIRFILNRRWKWFTMGLAVLGTTTVVAAAAGILFSGLYHAPPPRRAPGFYGAPPSGSLSTRFVPEIGLFMVMFAGMCSKYLWDRIEVRRRKNESLGPGQPKARLELDFWDFVQPLLVGGIVFAAIVQVSAQLNLTSVLFSYQNGFFWQTLIQKKGATTVAGNPEGP